MNVKDSIYLTLLSLALLLAAYFGFQYYSTKAALAATQVILAKTETSAVERERESQEALVKAQEQNKIKMDKLYEQMAIADQHHKEEINEINTRYYHDMSDVDGMRNTIKTLNSQLSELPAETRNHYAATAANNLAECTATTVELEKVARNYYAELKSVLAKWPSDQPTPVAIESDQVIDVAP